MSPQIITVTIQAALFSALSTTLAQSITAYQTHSSTSAQSIPQSKWYSPFDLYTLLTSMAIAIIMTPPNYLYQRFLEDTFPSKVPTNTNINHKDKDRDSPNRLSKRNTTYKLLLDQSIAGPLNTATFIILANLSKRISLHDVLTGPLRREFWPMLTASWRVWPSATLVNLVLVPFDYRMAVGNTVGVAWGVYVALRSM